VTDQDLIALGGFVLALGLLEILAMRFAVDSRRVCGDRRD
jgi:hypothetical protein